MNCLALIVDYLVCANFCDADGNFFVCTSTREAWPGQAAARRSRPGDSGCRDFETAADYQISSSGDSVERAGPSGSMEDRGLTEASAVSIRVGYVGEIGDGE